MPSFAGHAKHATAGGQDSPISFSPAPHHPQPQRARAGCKVWEQAVLHKRAQCSREPVRGHCTAVSDTGVPCGRVSLKSGFCPSHSEALVSRLPPAPLAQAGPSACSRSSHAGAGQRGSGRIRKYSSNTCSYQPTAASDGASLGRKMCAETGVLLPCRSRANAIISRKERGLEFKYIMKKTCKVIKLQKLQYTVLMPQMFLRYFKVTRMNTFSNLLESRR